jgi:hypothetical protein
MSINPLTRLVLRDRGAYIAVGAMDAAGIVDHIPAYVYEAKVSQDEGLILVRDRERFELPERKYGKHKRWFNAITRRYDRQNPSMGVILIGLKGTGKSMLAEDICNWGLAQGLPTLMITNRVPVSVIHAALQVIGPCIVYFDEFGKSYRAGDDGNSENERDKMITLFSDSSHKGVVFIVTGNGDNELSDFMIDRPGRFEFRIRFHALDVAAAAEIAAEYRLNEQFTDMLLRHTAGNKSSVDIATKVASVMRACKTEEEFLEELSILNVPAMRWYAYELVDVLYRGVKQSQSNLRASVKDNIITLSFLDEKMELIDTVSFNAMLPNVPRLRKIAECGIHHSATIDDEDHLPTGEYLVKVNDDVTVMFRRYLTHLRNAISASCKSQDELDLEKANSSNTPATMEGTGHDAGVPFRAQFRGNIRRSATANG